MSNESPREASTLAAIFQKAYARAVALQRLDEQLAVMMEQRQKLEADFREAQAEVNIECERMLKHGPSPRMLTEPGLAEASIAGGNGRMVRVKPVVASGNGAAVVGTH